MLVWALLLFRLNHWQFLNFALSHELGWKYESCSHKLRSFSRNCKEMLFNTKSFLLFFVTKWDSSVWRTVFFFTSIRRRGLSVRFFYKSETIFLFSSIDKRESNYAKPESISLKYHKCPKIFLYVTSAILLLMKLYCISSFRIFRSFNGAKAELWQVYHFFRYTLMMKTLNCRRLLSSPALS